MAYARPLGHTFNQLNLHMYRLPDGQRGALRSTSLALAREASKDDSGRRTSSDSSDSNDGGSNQHSYNPFKGIKRLYSDFRRRKSRSSSPDEDSNTRLRKFYSTPLNASKRSTSPPVQPAAATHKCKTTQASRRISEGNVSSTALGETSELRPRSRASSNQSKRVRFASSDPEEHNTYSPEEYDRRVVDPWELLTKEARNRMRDEMAEYTSQEMELNDVYNTNDSKYCTLCWRQHCHCRALSKDIWRRARSTSMVRAGA
ncbi:hypothetical protein BX070DRAFT_223297 [Coemansia spiralis]|nr:hypothetical protein BX070DRAFT_223297 [Coemansia spiralis]